MFLIKKMVKIKTKTDFRVQVYEYTLQSLKLSIIVKETALNYVQLSFALNIYVSVSRVLVIPRTKNSSKSVSRFRRAIVTNKLIFAFKYKLVCWTYKT